MCESCLIYVHVAQGYCSADFSLKHPSSLCLDALHGGAQGPPKAIELAVFQAPCLGHVRQQPRKHAVVLQLMAPVLRERIRRSPRALNAKDGC
jgi:hypothetical protein